jgi:ubiquinone/menaquinone biosynthesis C-methylase UbiE
MPIPITDQKKYYDKTAEQFEERIFFKRANRNHQKKIQKICELLDLKNKTRSECCILEIGAGTGLHASYLTNHFADIMYVGLDISEKMLHEAQKKFQSNNADNWNFLAGDGNLLPFRDNSFDAVYISGSLHHFPDPFNGFKEAYRIVKSDGAIVVMEPNWLFPLNFLQGCFSRVERNILKMRKRNFLIWTTKLNMSSVAIENFIYTPPFSFIDAKILDRIDQLLGKIPLVSSFSIMIYLSARKINKKVKRVQ